jgi:hypothetical protein
MDSIAFAIPLKKGMREQAEKLADELVEGERSKQFHERTRAYGYSRVKVFAQHHPQEMIIIYLEGEDVHRAMEQQARSDDDFEKWFRGMVKEIAGYDPGKLAAQPPSELLHDWHAERGNARVHHPA